MAEKLRQSVELLRKAEDPDILKETAENLFKYAIEKSGTLGKFSARTPSIICL